MGGEEVGLKPNPVKLGIELQRLLKIDLAKLVGFMPCNACVINKGIPQSRFKFLRGQNKVFHVI